ncbi:MAG: hypothetical protein ACK5LJ_04660 [Paracoccus sp. (in: a-proteobacteria)]
MTTYEGGVRVPSLLRWPGAVPGGQVLNGIQSHQDMFTSLAVAAGIEDPKQWVLEEKNQYLDGVDNTAYWKGEADQSVRDFIIHYYEANMTAVRMGAWKWHFLTKEDYYAPLEPRTAPLVFNIRMDPYESYGNTDSYGHLVQKVSWQIGPMNELIGAHLASLAEFPPVQASKSFDMSTLVTDFLSKGVE